MHELTVYVSVIEKIVLLTYAATMEPVDGIMGMIIITPASLERQVKRHIYHMIWIPRFFRSETRILLLLGEHVRVAL